MTREAKPAGVKLSKRAENTARKMAGMVPGGEAGESIWIDVIRKMDEVYADLIQYEAALEQKNAALEESQQFIFSVLTSMSDVLIVCDRHGTIQEVNQALTTLTGRTEDALRGTPLPELFADAASREQAARLIELVQGGGPIQDSELQIAAAGGAAMPVALNCTPRFNPLGKLVGLVVAGRPVGDLRKAYQALRDAHEELKRAQQQLVHSEKMASLGQLVAGVAHELNNPISFVLGNVHALQKYAQRIQRYLDAIHAGEDPARLARLRGELRIDHVVKDLQPLIEGTIEGAERTRSIVDGLKRFSAVDREDNAPFDLVEVLERSVHWVVKATGSRVEVTWDIPERIQVLGSAGQMQQVLVNLVQNAVDAMAQSPRPRLEITVRKARDEAEVTLRDNGPGIPPEQLSRVFNPFFTTKPVGKGTGLGLSISYGIVERHGGRLSVANHPEGGAAFTLTLPRAN
ncbi:MAG TPA: ATP-binding protein [Burkholderiales bacterium]|nr:ATP-binding protein [Burkholderiales bacterium]